MKKIADMYCKKKTPKNFMLFKSMCGINDRKGISVCGLYSTFYFLFKVVSSVFIFVQNDQSDLNVIIQNEINNEIQKSKTQ